MSQTLLYLLSVVLSLCAFVLGWIMMAATVCTILSGLAFGGMLARYQAEGIEIQG